MTVPSNITRVNQNAFRDCSSLVALDLPSTTTFIGDWSLGRCNNLYLTVRAVTPPTYDNAAFSGKAIYVPSESVEAYKAANGWKGFASKIQAIQE